MRERKRKQGRWGKDGESARKREPQSGGACWSTQHLGPGGPGRNAEPPTLLPGPAARIPRFQPKTPGLTAALAQAEGRGGMARDV